MQETEARVEQVELSKGEENDALELIQECQSKRTKKKLVGVDVPGILLPYQQRWHEDKSQIRFCVKSRRIGYSWGCLAAEGALEAAQTNGMDQFYMGYNMAMAAENIGDAAFFARAYGLASRSLSVSKERHSRTIKAADSDVLVDEKKDIYRYKINFASGHVYEALSSSPWNWRGRQGHARVDEAAFHKNLNEVIKGALAFLMWGGRLDVVGTHNGADSEFAQLDRDIITGNLDWSRHFIDFDLALADGLYKRICLISGEEWSEDKEQKFRDKTYSFYPSKEDADEELSCIPKSGSGVYFSRLLLEHCNDDSIPIITWSMPSTYVTDSKREKIADDWIAENLKPVIDNMPTMFRSVYGQDFGRDGDLSVKKILQEIKPGLWKTAFDLELRNIPFDIQKKIMLYILDNIPLFHHAKFDARGNGQSHAEAALQVYGEQKIDCVMLTQGWYGEWFPKYRTAYEDKSIIVRASEDVIADHRLVKSDKGRPYIPNDQKVKGSDGNYRHGDSAVAGLMAWAAAMEEGRAAAGISIDNDNNAYVPERMRSRQRDSMFSRNR
tara:strand:- start:3629 stop:5290 length:1662 start_codon:yes stop_codon:yes gene_type:complete